jgi:gluconolactonase
VNRYEHLTVREVARDLAFPEGPTPLADGSVLVSELAAGRITRIDPHGGRSTVAQTGGGPNGLAVLADGDLVVCQNGGSRWGTRPWPYDGPGSVPLFTPIGPPDEPITPQVQRITRDGAVTTLCTTDERGNPLKRPSDIVADAAGGFYMTDFGATRGRTRELAGVLYGTPDGRLHEVVYPVELPNGITLAPDETRLYVTETRTRRVWAFALDSPGVVTEWHSLVTIPSGGPINFGGVDGCCVDADGNIVVATLGTGGVTVVSPAGDLLGQIPMDDPMTTNAAFGGIDGRTLFVTLGSSGRLMAVDDWPHEGRMPLPQFS